MTIHELNQWHFECLHPNLAPTKIKKYKNRFNDFIEEMWNSSNEEDEPQLEVAQVENCVDKSGRPSAVRVQLRLIAAETYQGNIAVETFRSACKRLCEGIFSSMLNRDLLQSLSLVTNYALMGIAPLSPVLKVSWTTIALAQAVTMEAPTFRIFYEPRSFWSEWGKGLFIALTMMYDSQFDGIKDPVNLDRLKSICSTSLTIVRAATGFARNHVDPELLKKKDSLEEEFVRHAKKFELYQMEIERNDSSKIPPDTVITIQELMIDINSKAFDLMSVTGEVETVLLNLQNEQKWATATAGSMSLAGAGAASAGLWYGCALWACATPAAIAIVAAGLAAQHYSNVDKHRKERLRMSAQRQALGAVRGHISSYAVALLYPSIRGSEDIELSNTSSKEISSSTSSALSAVPLCSTSGSLVLPEQHQRELEGLAEKFSKMRRDGITQAKWFKAITTEEGLLVVNNFKALRNDPNFNARWNLPDQEESSTEEEQDADSDHVDRAAEEQRRLEGMAEQQARNSAAIANIRDEFRTKMAIAGKGKRKNKATAEDDSEYDRINSDQINSSGSRALDSAGGRISATLRKRQPLTIA